ncbi:FAD-dependent oxidoreductase [Kineococcus sp. TBRC 1896]|uniref:ferredoxin--NADP(+) reductase n=1 Tax=Kineococcus mangrovi TaxID=1660183 RepID=A0ABV4I2H5_9ACTN
MPPPQSSVDPGRPSRGASPASRPGVEVPPAGTVAVVGTGPAGIYSAQMLLKQLPGVSVDLFDKLPAPFGLVRYGVAPDHPAIKRIQEPLQDVLESAGVRLLCNVEVGRDVSVQELSEHYDAVVLATGAEQDAPLDVPGHDLPGSHGAAAFVAWYNSHPDADPRWSLRARAAAVVGGGNVALDVTRVLAQQADRLLSTDVSDDVHEALRRSELREVHVFVRRGPVGTRFSPLELRELGEQPGFDVVVDPGDVVVDDHTRRMVEQFSPKRQVLETLTGWAHRDPASLTAPRRVHLHFFQAPVLIGGTGSVEFLRTERTEHDEVGHVRGTGRLTTTPVQAVYRAVGYASSPVPGAPFDRRRRLIPNRAGRVLDDDGGVVPGLYVTGWAKRGPVGLIGSTKSDARETVTHLVEDLLARGAGPGRSGGVPAAGGTRGLFHAPSADVVDLGGWSRIHAAELAAGVARRRDRVKIATRRGLLDVARAGREDPDPAGPITSDRPGTQPTP